MRVRLADRIGFCFGVKRAVRMAEEALGRHKKIYSLGYIIHNRQVVNDLSHKGLKVIKDASVVKDGAILISSHGISPKVASRIMKRGLRIIDTTCPFVMNAQKVARRLSEEGYSVIIVGDAAHPEVRALVDFVPTGAVVVRDARQAAALKLKKDARVSIISQTTQSTVNFTDAVRAILEKKPKELRVFNTICNDAEERQRLASNLAKKVGLMLIVGGRNSANTRRLFDVCKRVQKNSHLIETDGELKKVWFNKTRSVGIASGASTPDRLVKKVVNKIHRKGVV